MQLNADNRGPIDSDNIDDMSLDDSDNLELDSCLSGLQLSTRQKVYSTSSYLRRPFIGVSRMTFSIFGMRSYGYLRSSLLSETWFLGAKKPTSINR